MRRACAGARTRGAPSDVLLFECRVGPIERSAVGRGGRDWCQLCAWMGHGGRRRSGPQPEPVSA